MSQLQTDIDIYIDMTKLVVTVQDYTKDVISVKEVDVRCKISHNLGHLMTSQISRISNLFDNFHL